MIKTSERGLSYPYLWQSICKRFRIIRCKDDIQNVVQVWQSPKCRPVSSHSERGSIARRWVELHIPSSAPSIAQRNLPQDELELSIEIVGL